MSGRERVYLAVDLGASSGRVVAGSFNGENLVLHEVHRFDNGPVTAVGRMHWDLLALWNQIQIGLAAAASRFGAGVASIGVDTWGVDFALLARGDELLGNPLHYRDRRTAGILEKAFAVVPREAIFAETGLQFMEFNTLYQLWSMKQANSPLLDVAERLLMIPDVFHWLLTGEKSNELTNATTTQFFDPLRGDWATRLLDRLGIPTRILGPVTQPGTRLGPLLPDVADRARLARVDVVLPGTHDTASAVMAVPAASPPSQHPDWCYISSGTWSLMGAEVPSAVINDRCRELNFTNEGGVGGTTRLLKNIAGLWLVQECRRVWKESGQDHAWDDLVRLSECAPPLVSLIQPDDARFVAPRDMPAEIREFCLASGQRAPENHGAVVRCALESLALRYRQVLEWLEQLTESRIETIHVVGGGAKNRLLCQMTADACQRTVVAGPVEATAIGNLMMQAVARGDLGSIKDARAVIRRSFDVDRHEPRDAGLWQDAYARFVALQ